LGGAEVEKLFDVKIQHVTKYRTGVQAGKNFLECLRQLDDNIKIHLSAKVWKGVEWIHLG
jgi:hypothetical protein